MTSPTNQPLPSNRRLDSWKEIAAFLGRGERTVKRWEQERALPVRRLPGKAKGSVFAFTDELTEWLKSAPSAELEESGAIEAVETDAEANGAGTLAAGVKTEAAERKAETAAPLATPVARKKHARSFVLGGAVLVATLVALLYLRSAPLAVRLANTFSSSSRDARNSGAPTTPAGAHTGVVNPEAQDLYLKGRYEWNKRTPESLHSAVDYFMQAIVRQPDYAQAYAGLADTYDLLREYTSMPSSEAFPRAIAAAKKAVELDDSLAEAHRALAFGLTNWEWDFAAGEREFKRAIALAPNDPVAHHWYATGPLLTQGRFPEALAEIERARELDPTSNSILADKGLILLDAQREPEAVAVLKQVEATDPSFLSSHRYLVPIAVYDRNPRLFIEETRNVGELSGNATQVEMAKKAESALAAGGPAAMWQSVYASQKRAYEKNMLSSVDLALICTLLGKKEEAIDYLWDGYAKRDPNLLGIRYQPGLRPLLGEPRYRELLGKIGLPPA